MLVAGFTGSEDDMQATAPEITIRIARDDEARACRILLPEMFPADQMPDLLTAISDDAAGPHFAGALAMSAVNGPREPGFTFLLHVVPSFRRQGIGRGLLAEAIRLAVGRTPALRALNPVPTGSDAARFLAACGFDEHDEIRYFEADTAPLHTEMQQLRARAAARGMIPAEARLLPLRDAPAGQVADMVAAEFPASRAQMLARLQDSTATPYDLNHSTALMLAGRLCGLILASWRGEMPLIEARIVAPGFRGGWANLLLLEQITSNGLALHKPRFQFFADSRISDTMSLARRARADLIRVEQHFRRHLP